ncbi:MAG TPA: NADH-quinone oxidoreductase subunit B family protein [Solirubrobacteraceae bacterium]|nr:NADH-quinone oxidoreductase subunit B family protein [Solirubrobacteraceae bacterium]
MEVRRERLRGQPAHVDADALRVRSLNAHQLLRGADLEGANRPAHLHGTELDESELERYVHERVLTTTLESTVAWARSNSFFPLAFGLACCAMEQFHTAGSRMDIARFGFEAFRASPRQADLIILAGRVSIKMAPIIRRLYDQMLEPKWAISMGACCSSMGVFNNYALVPADKFLPIDVHVPGCPPRPESLMHGILKLRKMVQDDPDLGWRDRYQARGTEEVIGEGDTPDVVDARGAAAAAVNAGVDARPAQDTPGA